MSETRLAFLDTLPIFKYLTHEELRALAAISTEYEVPAGAVLAYQRDVADALYIVRSGRLYARGVDEQGVVREAQAYAPGEHFDDVWLFTPRVHPATVRVTDAGRIVVIRSSDFIDFLERYPEALDHLAPEYDDEGNVVAGLSSAAWEEAQKSRMSPARPSYPVGELPAEELIEFATRRSRWLLLFKIVPLFVVTLAQLALFTYLSVTVPLFSGLLLGTIVPLLITAILGAIMILQWLDWRNDFFVITSSHIIHYEFHLTLRNFGTVIKRTPVDQVQSVEVDKPNLLAHLLDIGTARITTAAQSGVIYFDYIDEPGVVRETLTRLQQRVRELDAGREQALMRESLEQHFEANAPFVAVEDGEDDAQYRTRDLSLRERLRRRFASRLVDGETITYRKHLFVLFQSIRWPVLVGSVLFLVFAALLFFGVTMLLFWSMLVLAVIADAGWFVWQVEDWRNDTFQVTSRYVIDIDRQPFGTGESRKQAELSNVQNISADRPGLLPTLFNYGNVYIETAGVSADMTFENVANPNQVQRDIFDHREQFRRQQRIRDGAQRRKEYAVMLDVYKQALEQGRIPRRTPPPEFEA
ncbi:MAG TPA: cyclic nucleotide-binding domain-containing protein [Candidatus Binatia bacterium]|nr:cyclic nucleotide-binding domain-containing protein [Candidatus Binatia bacterium]